ncbi:hypothetical protein [Neisseria bergeri]|uniref:hypothetical protein n=1 Tax=Neisseria bergeri TaxID=1906581 RepID=UPI00272BB779|nr:hypothetical protein [Neisseria bergeri]
MKQALLRRLEGWGLTVRKQWQSGLFLSDIVWVFFSMIYFRLFMQYFPIDGFYSGLTKTGTALPRLSSKRTIL